MIYTFTAIVLAFAMTIASLFLPLESVPSVLFGFMTILGGVPAWIALSIIYSRQISSLQKLEWHSIPFSIRRFQNDKPITKTLLFIYFFIFGSFAATAAFFIFNAHNLLWLFSLWFILFGALLDLFRDLSQRLVNSITPLHGIKALIEESKQTDDGIVRDNLNTLTEIALRTIDTNQITLATESLQAFAPVMESFFEAKKNLEGSSADEIHYMLFYLFQRLSLIQDLTLAKPSKLFIQQMISLMAKTILIISRHDLTLALHPINKLGALALETQALGMHDISSMATSAFIELSKVIVNEMDLSRANLEAPFSSIIATLDALEKNNFKRDKSVNIRTLMLPFQDLRLLFTSPRVANHKDTPAILAKIEDILGEFAALEQVMVQKGKLT